MFASIVAQSRAVPRPGGNAADFVILALVAGAMALVFWPSRPSVMLAAAHSPQSRPRTPIPPRRRSRAPDGAPAFHPFTRKVPDTWTT